MFSIVMPSYNQAAFLQRAIDSVLDQQGVDLELIVIDGGSTDGSVDLLKMIDDPRLLWISEKDNGQTDAINKGFRRASGDLCAWLNSDDEYAEGALAAAAEAFEQNPKPRWLVGRAMIIDEVGEEIRKPITRYKDRKLRRYSYRALLRENFICQMSVFWRRGFAEQIGPLDGSLHFTMDYEYWLRMGKQCDPLVLDKVLAKFRWHDASKTGSINRRQFDEQYEDACRYFEGDRVSQIIHRLNVEKIVWSYRLLKLLGY